MSVAKVSALRSKDPNTQVGACIVNDRQQIIATGYNGLPRLLDDDNYPWARTGKFLETKYPYIVHAELNAILSATVKLENSVIYVSLFPCNECAKAIIQSGIQTIIYEEDKYENTENNIAAKRMLGDANFVLKKLAFSEITIKV